MRTVGTGLAVGLTAQLTLLAALAGTTGITGTGWLVGGGCALAMAGLLRYGLARSAAYVPGPADRVTVFRATFVVAVAALVADAFVRPERVTALVALGVVALVLDAVDGSVARRTNTVSAFGARFDMEIDAFLILVLSVYLARPLGLWVLAIGLARYLFMAASWLLPWLREPVPPRYWCKVVAAIQGIALLVGVANVLPTVAVDTVLALALALLVESFGRQVWWLRRHRRPAPVPLRSVEPYLTVAVT